MARSTKITPSRRAIYQLSVLTILNFFCDIWQKFAFTYVQVFILEFNSKQLWKSIENDFSEPQNGRNMAINLAKSDDFLSILDLLALKWLCWKKSKFEKSFPLVTKAI